MEYTLLQRAQKSLYRLCYSKLTMSFLHCCCLVKPYPKLCHALSFLLLRVCHLNKENKENRICYIWGTETQTDFLTYNKSVAEGLISYSVLPTFLFFQSSSTYYLHLQMINITITTMMLCYYISLRMNKNASYGLYQFYIVVLNVTNLHP